ncbi:MAG: tetratricopeptide repeat protein [Pseudomonadales bacterium]
MKIDDQTTGLLTTKKLQSLIDVGRNAQISSRKDLARQMAASGEAISMHGVEAWFKHQDSNYASAKPSLHPDWPSYAVPKRRWGTILKLFDVSWDQIKLSDQDFQDWCFTGRDTAPAPVYDRQHIDETPRILVLPCVAQQPGSEQVLDPHIVDGITEDIVAGLSASRWLIVYDIGTSLSLSGSQEAPAELGRKLGAHYVLHGRLRGTREQIKASFFLVDVPSQTVVSSKQLVGEVENMYQFQDQILKHMIGSIEPEFLSHQSAVALQRPSSFRQWELVMRARYQFWQTTYESTKEARELVLEALKLDESNSRAWSLLAMTHLNDCWLSWTRDMKESMFQADKASRQAVQADDQDSWAHHTRAAVLGTQGQLAEAEEHLNRALAINPYFAAALGDMTRIRVFSGNYAGAAEFAELAIEVSPRDPHLGLWCYWIGLLYFAEKDYQAAIPWLNKSAVARPDWNISIILKAVCLYHAGNQTDGEVLLKSTLPELTLKACLRSISATHPFADPEPLARYTAGLHGVGLN